jgi:response regulator NasT
VALLKTIDELEPDASDAAPETIREAVRAGVSAYVVDGLSQGRIKSIIDVAWRASRSEPKGCS